MIHRLLRDRFWISVAFFIAVWAFLAASTVNTWIRPAIESPLPTQARATGPMAPPSNTGHLRASSVILQGRNIFDPSGGPVVPARPRTKPKPQPKARAAASVAAKSSPLSRCNPSGLHYRSSLKVTLTGVIMAADQQTSLVAVYDRSERKTHFLRVGDELGRKMVVCEIEPRYVKIARRSGRLEYLELGTGKGPSGSSAPIAYRRRYAPPPPRPARRRRPRRRWRKAFFAPHLRVNNAGIVRHTPRFTANKKLRLIRSRRLLRKPRLGSPVKIRMAPGRLRLR